MVLRRALFAAQESTERNQQALDALTSAPHSMSARVDPKCSRNNSECSCLPWRKTTQEAVRIHRPATRKDCRVFALTPHFRCH
jgi:hypothetical protein